MHDGSMWLATLHANPAEWVTASSTLVLAFATLIIAGVGIVVFFPNASEYRKMRDEYDEKGIPDRGRFWGGVTSAYKEFPWQKEWGPKPESIQQFVEEVHGPPPRYDKHASILAWKPLGLTPKQQAMWNLCTWIYPTPKSRIEGEFGLSRSRLGGFWERYTERFSARRLARRYAKEYHTLVLLSWLDFAHRHATGEDHPGKQTMYQLAEMLDLSRAYFMSKEQEKWRRKRHRMRRWLARKGFIPSAEDTSKSTAPDANA